MSMIDALKFAEQQQVMQEEQERARRARQEGQDAMQRARDEMLRQQMEQASSVPIEAPTPLPPQLPNTPINGPGLRIIPTTGLAEQVLSIDALHVTRARAQAHAPAPVELCAGIVGHSRAPDDESELANSLIASWQSEIDNLATATAAMPSKGIGRIIRQGIRARGHTGRESVILERLVWQRRKAIVAQRKAAKMAALDLIAKQMEPTD